MRVILTETMEHEDGRRMQRRMEASRPDSEGPIPEDQLDAMWRILRENGQWRPALPESTKLDLAIIT